MIKYEYKASAHNAIAVNDITNTNYSFAIPSKLHALKKLAQKMADNDFYGDPSISMTEDELLFAASQLYRESERVNKLLEITEIVNGTYIVYNYNGVRVFIMNTEEFIEEHYRLLFYTGKSFDQEEERVSIFLDKTFASNDDTASIEIINCMMDVLDGLLLRRSGVAISASPNIVEDRTYAFNDIDVPAFYSNAYFKNLPSIIDIEFMVSYFFELFINLKRILLINHANKEEVIGLVLLKAGITDPEGNRYEVAFKNMLETVYKCAVESNINSKSLSADGSMGTEDHMNAVLDFFKLAVIGFEEEDDDEGNIDVEYLVDPEDEEDEEDTEDLEDLGDSDDEDYDEGNIDEDLKSVLNALSDAVKKEE